MSSITQHNFDAIIDRSSSGCEKYGKMEKMFGANDIIPLWIADMDFESADFILQSIQERLNHGVMGYTYRCETFWNSIHYWLKNQHDWNVNCDWLHFSPGVVAGVVFTMLSNTQEGDGVLIQPPVYHPFANVINSNNRKMIANPLKQNENGEYYIDFKDMEKKAAQSKVFILCNPQNPTGRVFTKEELLRMGEICLKHNLIVISDEIHMDFVYKPYKHIHFASISKEFADITITLSAPSKTFNIAGLCTSYAIISNETLRDNYCNEMQKYHCDNSNVFGVEALKKAYSNQGVEWVQQLLSYLEENIKYVLEFLTNNIPSIKCVKPQSTFLLWFDFREWGLSSEDLRIFLIQEAKLGLNDGSIYGSGGEGFQRINIGTPLVIIKKAMGQLHSAAKERGFC